MANKQRRVEMVEPVADLDLPGKNAITFDSLSSELGFSLQGMEGLYDALISVEMETNAKGVMRGKTTYKNG